MLVHGRFSLAMVHSAAATGCSRGSKWPGRDDVPVVWTFDDKPSFGRRYACVLPGPSDAIVRAQVTFTRAANGRCQYAGANVDGKTLRQEKEHRIVGIVRSRASPSSKTAGSAVRPTLLPNVRVSAYHGAHS